MDEKDYRETLSKEELEARAYLISFKVIDFELLEKLNRISQDLGKNWDELINIAIKRLLNDVNFVNGLRK